MIMMNYEPETLMWKLDEVPTQFLCNPYTTTVEHTPKPYSNKVGPNRLINHTRLKHSNIQYSREGGTCSIWGVVDACVRVNPKP